MLQIVCVWLLANNVIKVPKGAHPKKIKMKVWNLSKGGGGVKPQIQTFLVFILVVLKSKSGDGLGRLLPVFGSKQRYPFAEKCGQLVICASESA
jgi:hypothetical protein